MAETFPKPVRVVNEKLLEEVRQKPCCACGIGGPSDPAHVWSRGSGGPDEKFNVIPLCRQHHSEQHQVGWRKFLAKYDLARRHLKKLGWDMTPECFHYHTKNRPLPESP